MEEARTELCEKCGSEMRYVEQIYTIGWECPGCGWGWVTTNPAISDRNKTYSIEPEFSY